MKLRKPKHNPYKIVQLLEEELADYTGAPYVVSVDSCTNALFLCCKYLEVKQVTIPSKTYLSVHNLLYIVVGKLYLIREKKLMIGKAFIN